MMNIKETIEFKKFGFEIVKCPICGKETLNNHYICSNCGWEYDDFNTLDEEYSQCNKSTVKEYREKFLSR